MNSQPSQLVPATRVSDGRFVAPNASSAQPACGQNRPFSFVAWALMAIVMAGCSEAPDLETSRRFQQAEELFAQASEPKEFLRVAALYQEIIDSGFRSGAVFYNQGNAWMQAGEKGRAIASYRQAQRLIPRDPYLAANLKQALGENRNEAAPLIDHIFFWQDSVSYFEKLVATTALLALAIFSALLRQSGRLPAASRGILYASIGLFAVMALSAGRDWIDFEFNTHGVVTEETVARKGGATSYEPAFTQPLQTGTEFILLESTARDWLRIQLSDGKEGWVPERSTSTY